MARGHRWFVAGLLSIVAVAAVAAFPAGHATAHTDFESSTPSDGEVVEGPLSEITISFTAAAEQAGEGFQVLDGAGAIRVPTSIAVVEDRTFVLSFDPPLASGEIGVRWEVRAGDAHPIDGAFTFTLATPTTETTTTTTATTTTATTTSTTTPPATTTTPATTTPATTVPSAAPTAAPTTTEPPAGRADETEHGSDLDEFLAGGDQPAGETRQLLGRIVSLPTALLAIGGLAFAATTLRSARRDTTMVLRGVGVAGGALAVGAALEFSGWLAQSEDAVASALTSTPGSAIALRLLGGIVVAAGATVAQRRVTAAHPSPALSAAIADAPPVTTRSGGDTDAGRRIAGSPALIAAVALVLSSFWFDGHTVSRGPRVVHATVDTVHVGSAAVWVGGVVAFAATVWARRRRGEPGRSAEMIVRFSTVATIALLAVAVAGITMTAMIIDGPGDVTSTEWGRTLLVKAVAVAIAAALGGYNHFRLKPALRRSPDDAALATRLRRTLSAEAGVLVAVAVITAWLVAAAV